VNHPQVLFVWGNIQATFHHIVIWKNWNPTKDTGMEAEEARRAHSPKGPWFKSKIPLPIFEAKYASIMLIACGSIFILLTVLLAITEVMRRMKGK
jgi:hypothetical protein